MNPDFPTDPRQELEARLSALILGQLPEEQAAELRQQLDKDPELLELYIRLKLTAELIREAVATEDLAKSRGTVPRLSHHRREQLLTSFKTISPVPRIRFEWSFKSWAIPAAAAAMILVLGAALLPSFTRAKYKAQWVSQLASKRSLGIEPEQASAGLAGDFDVSSAVTAPPPTPELAVNEDRGAVLAPKAVEPAAGAAALSQNSGGGGFGGGIAAGQGVAKVEAVPASPVDSPVDNEARRRFMQRYGLRTMGGTTATPEAQPQVDTTRTDSAADKIHQKQGNVGLSDGSVQQLTSPRLRDQFRNSVATAGYVPTEPDTTVNAIPPSSTVHSAVPPVALEGKEELARVNNRAYQAQTAAGVEVGSKLNTLGDSLAEQERLGHVSNDGNFDLFVTNGSVVADGKKLAETSETSLGFGVALKDEAGKVVGQQLGEYFAKGLPADTQQATVDVLARRKFLSEARDRSDKTPAAAALPSQAIAAGGVAGLGGKPANSPSEIQAGKPLQPAPGPQGRSESLALLKEKSQEENLRANLKTDLPANRPALLAPVPQPEFLTRENRFSTFSMNVSDVSFKLAAAALEKGVMPEAGTIRSEEFINAFNYHDPEPAAGAPIAFGWEIARSPFAHNRDLIRFSVKTAAQGRQPGRPLNIVVLLDNSGSMERADRARIIQNAFRSLATQLYAQDKLSIVLFARTAQLWVDGVAGNQATDLADGINRLVPQGGTNLEEAMTLAYQTALRHYSTTGINRVVLLTDGAANLGDVEPTALKEKVESFRKQGIALDCFGIGWEGYNDELMETLSRNGDGRYGFLNTPEEAESGFVSQLAGALRVAASDVKVQVEFNPDRVNLYRQIGYAKHQLTKEQFRDNTVDAAEIGAAESGNALYSIEMNPSGMGPIATLRVRYNVPGTTEYKELEWLVPYQGNSPALEQASPAMRLAITASAFSEWLASNPHAGDVTTAGLLKACEGVPQAFTSDARPKQLEWMIRQAQSLSGK